MKSRRASTCLLDGRSILAQGDPNDLVMRQNRCPIKQGLFEEVIKLRIWWATLVFIHSSGRRTRGSAHSRVRSGAFAACLFGRSCVACDVLRLGRNGHVFSLLERTSQRSWHELGDVLAMCWRCVGDRPHN